MAPTVAEILLPLPLRRTFSYRLLHPSQYDHPPVVGARALVGFGKGKHLTGIIVGLGHDSAEGDARGEGSKRLRIVERILDAEPVVTEPQRDLMRWLADYYLCSEGEVLKAALPTGLKLQSRIRVRAHPELLEVPHTLPDAQYQLLEALSVQGELSLAEAGELLGRADPRPTLRSLAARGLLLMGEQMDEGYRPKTVRGLTLAPPLRDREALRMAFAELKRAPTQEAILLVVADATQRDQVLTEKEILTRTGASASAAKSLVTKGYVSEVELEQARVADAPEPTAEPATLTPDQARALAEIEQHAFAAEPKPVLLHGVTGSGKTELYIRLMRRVLDEGRQALYLLPEIALTRQIVARVQAALGPTVGVYHSRFTAAQRVEIWNKLLTGHYRAVIGVRSALLLPFDDLGLVVVDEEHDASFKQQEPAPRYHARDAAVWLGHRYRFAVVLGSATPALESYTNALAGKYHLVELPHRVKTTTPPLLDIVDLKAQTRAQLSYGQLSEPLVAALRDTVARGEQAIVFKNRRGFAPLVVCNHCGHVPRCLYCDVSLTYHKRQQVLRCHLCGYTDERPDHCPECGHPELQPEGIGTERLEEHLADVLPQARLARMDLDTTRGREAVGNLLERLARGEVDVLVGTQMVTKGLDFERVTLAAVVQADAMLTWPDFRAVESSYQLLVQLAGRAGRHEAPGRARGRLVVQTRVPTHPVFAWIEQPYRVFYDHELATRREHGYPPFARLVRFELRHKDAPRVEAAAAHWGEQLRARWGAAVLGPEYPMVGRVRGLYRQQLLLKWRGGAPASERNRLRELIDAMAIGPFANVGLIVDVDPR